MSAILGVFAGPRGGLPDDRVARRMLAAMRTRGTDRLEVWRDGSALLAVSRHEWELDAGFSGPVLVAHEGDVAVAADASIYYRDDLRRRLAGAGVRASADTPSHLILAAYRAWGSACVDHLEGDWAFIVWDRRERVVLCSRDFAGARTLYHADVDGALVVASSTHGVVAHPDCPADLDPVAIAEAAAGLLGEARQTAYRAVQSLPPGFNLTWRPGAEAQVTRFWNPRLGERDRTPFAEAAEQLRALLIDAVAERLSPVGGTAVWLSGGHDSTAVFGCGEEILRRRGSGGHLYALNLRSAADDPGREDHFVQAMVDHWGAPIHWIDRADVALIEDPLGRAALRGDARGHTFEATNRALAAATRAAGCHVAFSGNGGDQLFQLSDIYLADLFRTGRWIPLVRDWQGGMRNGTGFRSFFRHAIQPNLPPAALTLAKWLRGGRPLRGHTERNLAEWFDRAFGERHELVARQRAATPEREGLSFADHEMHWYLVNPYGPNVAAMVQDFALEYGVEHRAPLYDQRIIELAIRRPREERRRGWETKRLLRSAMAGLLPDLVLEPRRYRTGTTQHYLRHSLTVRHADEISRMLDEPIVLAELGIVQPKALRSAWAAYRARPDDVLAYRLTLTLDAELWLRARREGVPPVDAAARELATSGSVSEGL